METYQPIYDAVRSRISGFNANELIERIACNFDISHHTEIIKQEFMNVAFEMQRPSTIHKPKLQRDGNQWCALHGEDLQSGIAGFGDSPAATMTDFDTSWFKAI